MNKIILLFVILAVPLSCSAKCPVESLSIKGMVLSKGVFVNNASVYLFVNRHENGFSSKTDDKGNFITEVSYSTYRRTFLYKDECSFYPSVIFIIVTHQDYYPKMISVNLKESPNIQFVSLDAITIKPLPSEFRVE